MAEVRAVTVEELRQLLLSIKNQRRDIYIRFRLLGEMWLAHFMAVILVTDVGVILNNEVANKFVRIRDLSTVVQFELDSPFKRFQPHFHYNVVPSSKKSGPPPPDKPKSDSKHYDSSDGHRESE